MNANRKITLIFIVLFFSFFSYGLSKWLGTWDNKLLQKISRLQKAAEQGDMRAQNDLGHIYEVGNGIEVDYTKSVYWYKKSAEKEFAPALYNLGRYYANGIGVNKDPRVAREYYSRSASQGFALAQVNFGKLLLDGKGGDIDYDQARELFKKAAEVGSSVAMYDLGYMYENGLAYQKMILRLLNGTLNLLTGVSGKHEIR